MERKPLIVIGILITVVIAVGLLSFICGLILLPAMSRLTPEPTKTSTIPPKPTVTKTPLPPIYMTMNVNEYGDYTVYWKRDLWMEAVQGTVLIEDFDNDVSNYSVISFPYLTSNGFLLNGESSAQILADSNLLPTGGFIHFRDWSTGLRFILPNNSASNAFGFEYTTSESWQLLFDHAMIPMPEGGNRFLGVILHQGYIGDFVLSSSENAQGGLSLDNISYVSVANATAIPSPTLDHVNITAMGGNVNIRRGPGANYDPLGVLLDSQTVTAFARNENGTWVYIPIPGSTDQFGWINITTQHTRIIGSIETLSAMETDPAIPAYIRNCTFNQMLLNPGDIRIPGRLSAPNNILLIFPGEYELYDATMINAPALDVVVVREGDHIDITMDGYGNSATCP